MLAIDTSGVVPVVVTSADFAGQTFYPTAGIPAQPTSLPVLSQPLQVIANPTPVITQGQVNSLKRGSDELLSHNSVLTNGTGMSPTQMDSANDAKKVKLSPEINNTPSRVLHFRGIPADTTEGEIVQLGMTFGRMTNLVLAKKKNQALLEMGDVASAQAMVNYFSERPPTIRGRTVYVQFSNHNELKTEQSSQNASAQAALQAANHLMQNMEEPKTVLRVIIENMMYPVTIDILKQIFHPYGQVLKIVTFNKNNTFQALIQFSDPIAAQTAKASLGGQNIYNNCNTLKIDFSKLQMLNVKYNNEKSRDYTNPGLPSGEGSPQMPGMDGAMGGALRFGAASVAGTQASMLASHLAAQQQATTGFTPQLGSQLTNPLVSAPHPVQGGTTFYTTESPTNFVASPTIVHPTTTGLAGFPQGEQVEMYHPGVVPFGLPGTMPAAGNAAAAAAMAGLRLAAQQQIGTVLLVSNLNEENVTPDALFTLFGVYGDVIRVKIMFNKKDNALVQFNDATQAQTAMTHLDKIKLWGKQIKIAPSKHSIVQLPKEGQPDAGLTKDYSNSPLHRFKKPNSKNYQNIYPPSATLHLSNIPPTTTEEMLVELFKQFGDVEAFKFFQKDRKMALIQMTTVEEAIQSLIATHNHQLAETSHLRVSFSKSTIKQGLPLSPEAGTALGAVPTAIPIPPQLQLQPQVVHIQQLV